jgi:BASS family bile acid:Na+ symporter
MYATMLFPLGAVAAALFSFFHPQILASWSGAILPLLGLVMLGMGMTLRTENFTEVGRRPRLIVAGVSLQFLLMPLLAYLAAVTMGLPDELVVGMVLVGSCPGGTASNVICYLARGDVALSITLTTVSTVLAVLLTPLLTWVYVGQEVPVPVLNMMMDILLIIVVPVAAGMAVNHFAGERLRPIKHAFPYVSVAAIILIIGIIVAVSRPWIPMLALPVIAAVFWHNLMGLAGGYLAAKWMGMDERVRRTLAIEVGMQNSGLAMALAPLYFTPVAALPGVLFSIWHNISGSILAGYWMRRSREEEDRLLKGPRHLS